MKRVYQVFRTVMVTVILLGLLIPALAYLLLSLPPVQQAIRDRAEITLSSMLNADISIGTLDFSPFNRLMLHDVSVSNSATDTIATIGTLGAGISLPHLARGNVVVTFVEIIGLDGHIRRPDPSSPLNIQLIIDALSPKDKTKPPTPFSLKINTVVLRQSAISYDVLSEPAAEPGRFCPSHIALQGIRADISLPRLANNNFDINVQQLALAERSGLQLNSLSGRFLVCDTLLRARQLRIATPGSLLQFADLTVPVKSLATAAADIATAQIDVELLRDSHVRPSDLAPLVPALGELDSRFDIAMRVTGNLDSLDLNFLEISAPDLAFSLDASGEMNGLTHPAEQIEGRVRSLDLHANGERAADVAARFSPLSDHVRSIMGRVGNLHLQGMGSWSTANIDLEGHLTTAMGDIALNGTLNTRDSARHLKGHVGTKGLNLGLLAGSADLGEADIDASIDATFAGKLRQATINGRIPAISVKGNTVSDIACDVDFDGTAWEGLIAIDDPLLELAAQGRYTPAHTGDDIPQFHVDLNVAHTDLARFGILPQLRDHRLSLQASAILEGRDIDRAVGKLDVSHLRLLDADGRGLDLGAVSIDTDNATEPQYFTVRSQMLDVDVEGTYRVTKLPERFRDLCAEVFPTLVPPRESDDANEASTDAFTYKVLLRPNEELLSPVVNIPVDIVEGIHIEGDMDCRQGTFNLGILAPYIIKGGTMLQNTAVNAFVENGHAQLLLTTDAVLKKDVVSLTVAADGGDDAFDTHIAWNYNRPKRYEGNLHFATGFERDEADKLLTHIDINPGDVVVNDTVWRVRPAAIDLLPGPVIEVADLEVSRAGQHVKIDGIASADPDDTLTLDLNNINLDYIFETLAIDNVMFGGDATGVFTASHLLTAEPHLSTDDLAVRSLSYNHSRLGDAHIRSSWDNSARAVTLNADILQPNGLHSYVDGCIKPMVDSLDFRFDANRINVGFMQHFMSAFADEVDGYASGKAHMWGSFKLIDMTGDVYAEDLKLKIAFTGTEYFATDSVHLTPGLISLNDITLHDIYGNTATLNGWLRHEYFKQPKFEFVLTDAHNLLVYDKPGNPLADLWYGRVFGNGSGRVYGEPGRVDIGVNMTTAEHSTFTFVLSDAQVANEYTFITFRDKGASALAETTNIQPEPVQEFYRRRNSDNNTDTPSAYNMDIQVDVTPQAEVILVMDPIGGDRIRTFGQGNLRLTYAMPSEELRMYGTYTLDRGSYNFTLQDIIIKDFNILSGSSIAFNGDPYSAQLDIKAEYVVQANLSDLDESFLNDKDLNRTNVPVHAQMFITGDMRQPDIAFDLAFPTLNSDIDRKVKSIISTEDMMNRQIVYLLALSRFYTPEYMASTTKGSELMSVASSTISSQIGSMLGKISDNWSIAPALRSDRGDFSDVEFDIALSSTLLNNRLLLNGNLGYRDKALNNNTFIGDFDVEYLLNRAGTFRLKAYNRYNDQNYYLKQALTTQGVGVQYRRDFDTFGRFFGSRNGASAPQK